MLCHLFFNERIFIVNNYWSGVFLIMLSMLFLELLSYLIRRLLIFTKQRGLHNLLITKSFNF